MNYLKDYKVLATQMAFNIKKNVIVCRKPNKKNEYAMKSEPKSIGNIELRAVYEKGQVIVYDKNGVELQKTKRSSLTDKSIKKESDKPTSKKQKTASN